MTIDRETVIRLAQKAGIAYTGQWEANDADLMRFAALVLEHERKPLDLNEIYDVMSAADWPPSLVSPSVLTKLIQLVHAVEAAHGITNKESSDAGK